MTGLLPGDTAYAANAGSCVVVTVGNAGNTPTAPVACTEKVNDFTKAANDAAGNQICYIVNTGAGSNTTVFQTACGSSPPGTCTNTSATNPNALSTSPCTAEAPKFANAANTAAAGNNCYVITSGQRTAVNKSDCASLETAASSQGSTTNVGGPTNLTPINTGDKEGDHTCGAGGVAVKTGFNFGCRGTGNAIVDLLFALFRFLSIGVGIVAIGSLIVAGIQYSASQGDPNMTKASIKRATNTILALLLYFLIYAIIEWIVPGGLFD